MVESLIQHRLQRARETLEEARLLAEMKHWNAAVNRLYYACFYAVSALLASRMMSASKHSQVRSLLSLHFVKTGLMSKDQAQLFNTLYDLRQESDYQDFFSADPQHVIPWLDDVSEFLQSVRDLIARLT
jgi:uncharacterized protein (UPF0332 family)